MPDNLGKKELELINKKVIGDSKILARGGHVDFEDPFYRERPWAVPMVEACRKGSPLAKKVLRNGAVFNVIKVGVVIWVIVAIALALMSPGEYVGAGWSFWPPFVLWYRLLIAALIIGGLYSLFRYRKVLKKHSPSGEERERIESALHAKENTVNAT